MKTIHNLLIIFSIITASPMLAMNVTTYEAATNEICIFCDETLSKSEMVKTSCCNLTSHKTCFAESKAQICPGCAKERPKLNDIHCTEKKDDACTICLEDFKNNDQIVELTCKHVLHKDCFKGLADSARPADKMNPICPACRKEIFYFEKSFNNGFVNYKRITDDKGGIKEKIFMLKDKKPNTSAPKPNPTANPSIQIVNVTIIPSQTHNQINVNNRPRVQAAANTTSNSGPILEFIAASTIGFFIKSIINKPKEKSKTLSILGACGAAFGQFLLLNKLNTNRFNDNNKGKTAVAWLSGLMFGGLLAPYCIDKWADKKNDSNDSGEN